MNISHNSRDGITISTKNRSIEIGANVMIGDYTVPGAGEYDIAGVQCEAQNLSTGTVYFIRAEDLTLTYLTQTDPEVTKLDDASATHILIMDVRSDEKAQDLKVILKSLEPSYLFLIGSSSTPELYEQLGLPRHEGSSLKITHSGLPLEGTFLVAKG